MGIEEIPADQKLTMTDEWHRAFKAAGCNPMCHCCGEYISNGKVFKLATVNTLYKMNGESKEVMLCDECTVEKMNALTEARKKEIEERSANGGGCYRVNGKIIHQ
jgi:hypothetical protein